MNTDRHELVTPMVEMAATMREMFTSLVAAGFSEWQACQIVGTVLASIASSAKGEERS